MRSIIQWDHCDSWQNGTPLFKQTSGKIGNLDAYRRLCEVPLISDTKRKELQRKRSGITTIQPKSDSKNKYDYAAWGSLKSFTKCHIDFKAGC